MKIKIDDAVTRNTYQDIGPYTVVWQAISVVNNDQVSGHKKMCRIFFFLRSHYLSIYLSCALMLHIYQLIIEMLFNQSQIKSNMVRPF